MTVINNEARLTALKRQKMLYELHCKHCINWNERNNVKYCPGCAIWDEFLKCWIRQSPREKKVLSEQLNQNV